MKTMKMLLGAIAVVVMASCSNEELDSPLKNGSDFKMTQVYAYSDKVGDEEIARVARQFSSKCGEARTRTGELGYKVSTLYADDGTPAIYVVNYDENKGFVLVSATKNMFPVLAYSSEGNFSVLGEKPEGLENWLNETRTAVMTSENLPDDSILKIRSYWIPYENPATATSPSMAARYTSMSEEERKQVMSVLYAKMNELTRQGYEIRGVEREITGDPALDAQIRDLVFGAIYPSYQEAWLEFSFAAFDVIEDRQIIENFVHSKWNQSLGYNQSFPLIGGQLALAGCGPVAVGQIMRYFEYPAFFNWQDMPNEMPAKATSDLLFDIANKSNANFGVEATGTRLDSLAYALNSYGYRTNKANHNIYEERRSIEDKRPVLMTGVSQNGASAHAWVCSGGRFNNGHSQWKIFTFTAQLHMDCVYTYDYDHFESYYFYMNWGWGGLYDGFYHGHTLLLPNDDSYSKNRVNVYVEK